MDCHQWKQKGNKYLKNIIDPTFLKNNGFIIESGHKIIDSAGYNYTDGKPFKPDKKLIKYELKKEWFNWK